jgi:hypothetical protein
MTVTVHNNAGFVASSVALHQLTAADCPEVIRQITACRIFTGQRELALHSPIRAPEIPHGQPDDRAERRAVREPPLQMFNSSFHQNAARGGRIGPSRASGGMPLSRPKRVPSSSSSIHWASWPWTFSRCCSSSGVAGASLYFPTSSA